MTSREISAFAAEEEKRVLSLKPVLAPRHGRYGDHPHQVYDAWPAEDADAPLVVLLHGGYWRYDRMHLTPFAAYLAQQGFSVLLPGFRRSGARADTRRRSTTWRGSWTPCPRAGPTCWPVTARAATWRCGARPAGCCRRTRRGTRGHCRPPCWRWRRSPIWTPPAGTASVTTRRCNCWAGRRCSSSGCRPSTRSPCCGRPARPGCPPCCCTAPSTRRCRSPSSATTRPCTTTCGP